MTLDRNNLRLLILEAVDEFTNTNVTEIDDSTNLFDLGMDSLEFTTIIVEVEERIGEDIPAEAFERFADLEDFSLGSILNALMGSAPDTMHGTAR